MESHACIVPTMEILDDHAGVNDTHSKIKDFDPTHFDPRVEYSVEDE